eukprot:s6667_g3.t1
MSVTHEADWDLCVVHASQPILSAENLVDFQRFMGELDRAGRENHFWKMWGAVWEVCHLPIPDEVLTHLSCGGRQVPLRRFVCVAPECRRCHHCVGGFQFPFLGPWSRESVCPDLRLSGYEARRLLATCRTITPQEQRMQRSSGFQVTDLIPPAIWRVIFAAELNSLYDRAGAKCSPPVAAGNKAKPFWKDPLVDVPEAEAVFLDPVDRSQRALAAWVLHVAASPPEAPMPHACVFCGTLVGVRDPAGACRNCRLRSAKIERKLARAPVTPEGQDVTSPRVERGLRGGAGSVEQTPGLAGVQEQSFCRVRGSSQGYHVKLAAIISVGLQLWAVGLALAIMPGDLGVYAAESLSAASAPESAYTALGEMSRQRVGQWREQHGFLSDADFAYAFRSYEDAMAQAGTLVAEEWADSVEGCDGW